METANLMNDFWVNFVANLSASLIALLLGIPFGLMLDRLVQKMNKKSQKRVLLQSIKDETIYNLRQMMSSLTALSGDLRGSSIPACNLSTSAWTAVTSGQQVEVLWESDSLRFCLYLYRIIDRIFMNIKRLELYSISNNDVEENQANTAIVRKMIAMSIREGLDVGQSLLGNLDKDLDEPLTEITGIDEVKMIWDTREGRV